jgi:hypothetical protein
MRWKNVPGIVLLLAAGLLLASCFTIEFESTFDEDGSGLHVYQATIERDAMDEFGGMGDEFELDEGFDESEETARMMGYDVERIDTDELIGIRLSRNYEDSENVGQILNDLFAVGADESTSAFTGTFTQDGNTHTLNVTASGTELFGEELDAEGLSPAMLSSFFTMTYTVRMPGELVEDETNGRILDDGRVQWDIPLTGTQTFTAVSETEGDGLSTLVLVLVIVLLFFFIGGAALIALLLLMRNRRRTPQESLGVDPADPDAPTAPFPHARQDPDKPPSVDY